VYLGCVTGVRKTKRPLCLKQGKALEEMGCALVSRDCSFLCATYSDDTQETSSAVLCNEGDASEGLVGLVIGTHKVSQIPFLILVGIPSACLLPSSCLPFNSSDLLLR